jgi:hypothetical protein
MVHQTVKELHGHFTHVMLASDGFYQQDKTTTQKKKKQDKTTCASRSHAECRFLTLQMFYNSEGM